MSQSRWGFKLSDAGRMIKAAQNAGLKITGVVLNDGKIVLQVDDGAAAHDGAPTTTIADSPR